jgi:Fe-S cluster assembly iron-binding protein IscA
MGVAASNIGKTEADVAWITEEPSDTQVEYWASPSQFTPLDENLVTLHLVHLTGLDPATTYHYRVMSRDQAGNLMVSEECTLTTLGQPATFLISNWDLSRAEVYAGEEVTISCTVSNIGDLAGDYSVEFKVDESLESAKEVTLEAGASKELIFTTTKDTVGSYTVDVAGLTFPLVVKEPAAGGGLSWWLIVVICIPLVLITAVASIMVSNRMRSRSSKKEEDAMYSFFKEPVESAREENQAEAVAEEQIKEEQAASSNDEELKMFIIKPAAIKKLQQLLRDRTEDPELAFRMNINPSNLNKLRLTLDKQNEDDYVLENEKGKILLFSQEVANLMNGKVLDYQETDQGAGFSIY